MVGPMKLPIYSPPLDRAETSPGLVNNIFSSIRRLTFSLHLFLLSKMCSITGKQQLIDPENPFGENFDTAYAYGPLQGRRLVIGLRYTLYNI